MAKLQIKAPIDMTTTLVKKLLLLTFACFFFYILGSYTPNSSSTTLLSLPCPPQPTNLSTTTHTTVFTIPSNPLKFEPQHALPIPPDPIDPQLFPFCPQNFTNYCPCQDPSRERRFSIERKFHRERHCPERAVRCLIPRPRGYRGAVRWPESRGSVWFANVPFARLASYKKSQNWVRVEGDRLVFPGGGTSFPRGAKSYVNEIGRVVPLKSGAVRTVLDVGSGVGSFGAHLMDFNILTMSIAPRDIHEAQVQFALERGLPAMLGILSTHRLPFPSRSFDMAHCSRCLVPWTDYDGLYLLEIDRVLRPGGYWVLSGPPINWRANSKGWKRGTLDLEKEQATLEDLASRLCWKKIAEQETVAVWRKPTNHVHCSQKTKAWESPHFCNALEPDSGWYTKMEPCITPLPKVQSIKDTSGGALEKWPKRLHFAPPRIRNMLGKQIDLKFFYQDNQLWNRRVGHYAKFIGSLPDGKYRNIMDMNAGFGSFAAALSKYPVWVMNVVPFDANNTLGIIYERGLIGTYMNWCEAFSTYPRTYDLIHADKIFRIYMDKCDIVDILLEMHRILRPEGALIIRDHVDVIVKVKNVAERMSWNGTIQHSEQGPHHPEKVLFIDNSEPLS
ncbi:hypothetical protein Sjap_019334 [Stephania japonica]|uniref:Methyltransferase n=1 Tax=Stephania japonica TaxID=461633 RepID=A0AAP0F1C7_9MAGN